MCSSDLTLGQQVSLIDLLRDDRSDVQGFVNPPRVRGKGQKGKGQGKDFMTLNKPLRGFSRVFQEFHFSNIEVQIEFKQC